MTATTTIRAGGWALILGALAFMGVFGYLAASFGYPEVLDGTADVVLPRLLGTGRTGRAVWALYAFLPIIWLPAGAIAATFDGLNSYLGNYVGEFLGELAFSAFFALSSWAMLRSRLAPHWVGGLGLATALAGFVGMFRNVTPAVAAVAAVNNYLLPAWWMIVFGVVLVRYRAPESAAA